MQVLLNKTGKIFASMSDFGLLYTSDSISAATYSNLKVLWKATLRSRSSRIQMEYFTIVVFVVIGLTRGEYEGPPVSEYPDLCQDMFPAGHGAAAQTRKPPFKVTAHHDCFQAGQEIRIDIESCESKIKGFFVQARPVGRNQLFENQTMSYGTFRTNIKNAAPISCFNQVNNAVGHHGAPTNEQVITVYWTAPANLKQTVSIGGTIVLKQTEFWVDVVTSIAQGDDCYKKVIPTTYESKCSGCNLTASIFILAIASLGAAFFQFK